MSSRGGPLEDIDAAETVPEHSSVLRPKVVVLGSIGSGKTALFRSFASHLKRNDPSTISPSRGGDEVGETALPPFSARHGLRATLPKQRAMSTDSVASYEDWGSIDASLRPSTTIEVHDVPYVASFPVTTSPARNDSGPFATPALDGGRLDVWDVPGTAAENPSMCTSVLRGAGALIVAVDAISMRTMEARFGLGMTDSVSMLAVPWLDAALIEPPSASPFAKAVGRAGGSVPSSRPPSPAPYGGNPFRAKRGHLDEEMLTVVNVGSAKDYSDTVPQLRAVVVLITKIDAVTFGGDEDERILCMVQRMMQERYQHVAPFADFAVLACSAVSGAGVCELVSKVGTAASMAVKMAKEGRRTVIRSRPKGDPSDIDVRVAQLRDTATQKALLAPTPLRVCDATRSLQAPSAPSTSTVRPEAQRATREPRKKKTTCLVA